MAADPDTILNFTEYVVQKCKPSYYSLFPVTPSFSLFPAAPFCLDTNSEAVMHPTKVVESRGLAQVSPPDVTYTLKMNPVTYTNRLSICQLEAIVYACQAHDMFLPNGARQGFLLGKFTFFEIQL